MKKENTQWENAVLKVINRNATALTNLAPEKGSAVNVLLIIWTWNSFPGAVFQKVRKQHTIGLLDILRSWSIWELYKLGSRRHRKTFFACAWRFRSGDRYQSASFLHPGQVRRSIYPIRRYDPKHPFRPMWRCFGREAYFVLNLSALPLGIRSV